MAVTSSAVSDPSRYLQGQTRWHRIEFAFWGGLTIGLVQQMSTLVLPYQLQNTAIFVVFLVIVFSRPQGMFGRVWERT